MRVAVQGLSRRVTRADFDEDWFLSREKEMGLDHRIHRKHWEHAIVAQIFRAHVDEITPTVLGFGVGREPMAAWFASQGCRVLATDAPMDITTEAWRNDETPQHAATQAEIPFEDICPPSMFWHWVKFQSVDMNAIPDELRHGQFDVTWSCGSFEHIGGIQKGLDFFVDQMECLKPGGLAIHTTEFNVIDNEFTIDEHDICLFRRRDFQKLEERLEEKGHLLWPLQLNGGSHEDDQFVDNPPYDAPVHINMAINKEWVTTSVVLVAKARSAQ